MRRYLVKLFIICILLTGCTSQPVQESSGQDAQNQYMFFPAVFQETEDFYLGGNMIGNYMHYYDKATGISGVLCADPSCGHDSSACGAYMEDGPTVSVWAGKLYWVAPEGDSRDKFLWRSDLSGMNREKLKILSFEDFIVKYQPQRYVVHRGMLYALGDSNTVSGTEISSGVTLVATPLDDSQEFTVLHEESFDQGINTTVRFVGDYAYISQVTFPLDRIILDVSIKKINLTTGETETIYEEAGMSENLGALWVTQSEELYLPGTDEEFGYLWRLENGKRVEVTRWQSDGLAVPKIMDGIAIYLTWPDQVRYIEIADLNGVHIYSGKLFPEDVPGLPGDPNACSFGIVGGDRDKLILNLQNHGDLTYPQDYTVLIDLSNNMKATVLWSTDQ